jgi:hypothetical protein
MKKNFAKFFCVLFVLLLNNVWAETQTFYYQVRIPVTEKTCDEEAKLLASRFETSTNIQVSGHLCLGIVEANFDGSAEQLYSLELTYKAPRPAPLYSAPLGGLMDIMTRSTEEGTYSTYNECLNQISEQIINYEKETGINAIAAFCSPAEIIGGYILQIDGFGKPKRRLEIFHLKFGADDSSLKNEILSFLTDHGANIVRIKGDAVLYYAESARAILQKSFGSFKKYNECDSQIDEVTRMFKNSGSKSISIVRCIKNEETMGKYELFGLDDGFSDFFQSEMPKKYYSFKECFQDRDHVLSTHSNRVIGAICGENIFSPSLYVMNLYEQ